MARLARSSAAGGVLRSPCPSFQFMPCLTILSDANITVRLVTVRVPLHSNRRQCPFEPIWCVKSDRPFFILRTGCVVFVEPKMDPSALVISQEDHGPLIDTGRKAKSDSIFAVATSHHQRGNRRTIPESEYCSFTFLIVHEDECSVPSLIRPYECPDSARFIDQFNPGRSNRAVTVTRRLRDRQKTWSQPAC